MAAAARKKRGRPPGKKNAAPPAPPMADGTAQPTLIKKYANRRLYDTKRSVYVTLEDLTELIRRGEEVQVVEDATGDDVTKRVMTQMILQEEESHHLNLLPVNFLKKLIQYQDEHMRDYFQKYMAMSLDMYMQSQRAMEQRMQGFAGMEAPGMGGMPGMPGMFPWMAMGGVPPTPPAAAPPRAPQRPSAPPPPSRNDDDDPMADELRALRKRLADLEQKVRK